MTMLVCPKCCEAATVRVDVADGESCQCDGCGGEWTVSEMRSLLSSWGPLLKWLDSHPAKVAGAVAEAVAS